MKTNSKNVLKTIIGILSALQLVSTQACGPMSVGPDPGNCVDMKWCQYKLYKEPLNWASAREICKQDGHSLIRITDAVEHSYLTSFLASSLSAASPQPFDATLWVGMQQVSDDVPRWHDDCATQDAAGGYIPAPAVVGDQCFVFDQNANAFTYDSCTNSKMFLCKVTNYDFNTCFTSTSALVDVAYESSAFGNMFAATDCAQKCSASNCVGYRYYPAGTSCKMATASLGLTQTKGALTEKFMKDIISTSLKTVTDPVTSQPCSTSAAAAMTSTAVPEVSSTVIPEPTTSDVPEPSSSSMPSDELTTSMGAVSSSTEDTSSTDTPQLTNTVTTVDLTTASLSTESVTYLYTGTPSSSCYHCFCNSNLMTSMSPEQLQSQIETLKKELTVEKKDLSSWKRKLISIPDERISAKSLGYLGAAMLAVVFGAVVIIDLPRFMNGFKAFYHSVCNHKKINTIE